MGSWLLSGSGKVIDRFMSNLTTQIMQDKLPGKSFTLEGLKSLQDTESLPGNHKASGGQGGVRPGHCSH